MSESPFFQFYPSDWLAGTRGLTAAETGVYITLVAMMYEAEGPVPNDPKRLARLCGSTPATFSKIVGGLLDTGKITEDERGFSNRRVEIEIKKRAEKRSAASASANARWQKTVENQQTENANASDPQCERNANQKPDTREEKGQPNGCHKKPAARSCQIPADFQIGDAGTDYAKSKGMPAEAIPVEFERFVTHHKAKGSRFKDWGRAWQSWCQRYTPRSNVVTLPARTALPAGEMDMGGGWTWVPGEPVEYNRATGEFRDSKPIRDRRMAEAEIAMRGCL